MSSPLDDEILRRILSRPEPTSMEEIGRDCTTRRQRITLRAALDRLVRAEAVVHIRPNRYAPPGYVVVEETPFDRLRQEQARRRERRST